MINFVKNILPVSIFVIGYVIDLVGKFISGIATIIYNVSITLHMLLKTNTGKKLTEIEKTTSQIINMYNNLNRKVQESRSLEENKLAKVLKNDKNIVQLGNKKDDDFKS